jgi:hypothetical protein
MLRIHVNEENDMKRKNLFLAGLVWLPAIMLTGSCDILGGTDSRMGELRISFSEDYALYTKSQTEIPDTSEFILKITDSKGTVVYDGLYGAAPESMKVNAGTYTVRALSCEFTKPAFNAPQFGDEQCVVVKSGGTVDVKLVCTQKNSGIRLRTDPAFLTVYPDGSVNLLNVNEQPKETDHVVQIIGAIERSPELIAKLKSVLSKGDKN